MLYKDWDIELIGEHIRIMPIKEQDEEQYGKLLLGKLYDQMKELNEQPSTGFGNILDHTEKQETHAIRLLEDDAFIGWIALQTNDEDQMDIGISLIPEEQNKGYGPEAVMLFANRLHKDYGLNEIYVRIEENNLQSQSAFAKLGAVLDKKMPDKTVVALREKIIELTGKEPEDPAPQILYFHIPLPIQYIQTRTAHSLTDEEITAYQTLCKEQKIKMVRTQTLDEVIEIFENSSDLEEAKKVLQETLEKIKKEL